MTLGGTALILLGFFGINLAARATSPEAVEGTCCTGGNQMMKLCCSDEQHTLLAPNFAEGASADKDIAQTSENL
jgi:hypothetical protein